MVPSNALYFSYLVSFENNFTHTSCITKSTGLATVAVGADGKYISACYNFTDFCIKLTRGSAEGLYIEALHKVTVKTREEIEASASLLGEVINRKPYKIA